MGYIYGSFPPMAFFALPPLVCLPTGLLCSPLFSDHQDGGFFQRILDDSDRGKRWRLGLINGMGRNRCSACCDQGFSPALPPLRRCPPVVQSIVRSIFSKRKVETNRTTKSWVVQSIDQSVNQTINQRGFLLLEMVVCTIRRGLKVKIVRLGFF